MLDLEEIKQRLSQLKKPVLELINQHQSLSEHELISYLQAPPYELINKDTFKHNDALFCTHFLIRHLLYKIQDDFYKQKKASLHIDTKLIQKRPYEDANTQQLHTDSASLRAYYLDTAELLKMDTKEVESLLNSFWKKFISYQQADSSLACLGLNSGTNLTEIEQAYRKLAMQHHPDKGGDGGEFAKINQAYQHLKRCYS